MTRSAWGLALLDDPLAWRMKAACTPADAEDFFIKHGHCLSRANERALALCHSCPVWIECGDYAHAHPSLVSVIAGGRVWWRKKGGRG